MDEDAASAESGERADGGGEHGEALHVRRERRLLNAVPRDARVNSHEPDGDARHHADEAEEREHHRKAGRRQDHHGRGDSDNAYFKNQVL